MRTNITLRIYLALMTTAAMSMSMFSQSCAASSQAAADEGLAKSHEFDFLIGDWHVHNRKLKASSLGSSDWVEFDASDSFHALPGGLGTEENYQTEHWQGFHAVGLHLFDPAGQRWFLYWADTRNSPGVMQTLASGSFTGIDNFFYGSDNLNGKPIEVRVLWKRIDSDHVRWEQAFSDDGRKTWETNWTMDFVRVGALVHAN